jgi:nucleotide-binding universal stress UspA family protein
MINHKIMKAIAVAIDFSEGSMNALRHAKEIAKVLKQSLILVHAYSPPILDPNIPVGLVDETYKVSLEILENKLEKEVKLCSNEGINTEYQLTFSDLSSALNDLSGERDITMVILGKTSHSSLIDAIIGSTASHLIDNLNTPILVIPENFKQKTLKKLCYGSQLEYDEEIYIGWAVELASYSGNGLEIANIKESDELDIHPNQEFLDSIHERFGKNKIQVIHRESRSLTKGLNQLIEDENISLLIVTSHKRGFLDGLLNPSKTKQIIKHTKIPVLIYSFE